MGGDDETFVVVELSSNCLTEGFNYSCCMLNGVPGGGEESNIVHVSPDKVYSRDFCEMEVEKVKGDDEEDRGEGASLLDPCD